MNLEQRLSLLESQILREENHDLQVQIINTPEFQFLKRKRVKFDLSPGYDSASETVSFTGKYKFNHGVDILPTYLVIEFAVSDEEDYGFLSIFRESTNGRTLREISDYPEVSKSFRKDFTKINSYSFVLKIVVEYFKKYIA